MPIQTADTIPQNSAPAEQQPRDFGQQIAMEYWRKTPHVFSPQGKSKPCGLCLLPEDDVLLQMACDGMCDEDAPGTCERPEHRMRRHLSAEPYPPQPTFTGIGVGLDRYMATLSCGHGPVGIGGTRTLPNVGDSYDCWDCRRPVDDRNRPGLPEEIHAQIEAQLPKCPECGGPIAKLPFIKRTVHAYQADVDWQTGEILAGSEHHDTLEEEPDWHISRYVQGEPIREIEVECANGHGWFENRLRYQYRNDEHIWTVLPPVEAQS